MDGVCYVDPVADSNPTSQVVYVKKFIQYRVTFSFNENHFDVPLNTELQIFSYHRSDSVKELSRSLCVHGENYPIRLYAPS